MSKIKNNLKGSKKTKKFIPNLSVTPNHVCFKNYEEGNLYKEHIQILNQDLKTYHLAIKFDCPDEIKLSIVGSSSKTRIDSGEDLLFEVEFRPTLSFRKESVDRRYEICLNIVNSNAKFFIPILVLSPNPLVNFPKEILLPEAALNTPAYSNIFVLNYSNQNQKFSFEYRSEIKVIPDCKTIGLKASSGSTFLIEFTPKEVGSFREKINVLFDNGKKTSIVIKCNVIPVNIFLNEENIEFPPTFIGLSESKEIHIVNNSDEVSYFEWLPIEQLQSVVSKCISIMPTNGELQPGTITAISFTFKPEDNDDDDQEMLNDVFVRFALKLSIATDHNPVINIRGKIVGPNFQLDPKLVDLGSIFLGETRYIDLNISNTGVVAGKITFQKSPSPSNDGIIKISSKFETVAAGETKLFKIKYLARKAGKFVEQAFFKVKNGERLAFVIQGLIKPLEVILDPPSVQFMNSTICVPQMQVLVIRSELPVEIDVELEIESTGRDDPMEFLEFFKSFYSKDDDNNAISIAQPEASAQLSFASSNSKEKTSLTSDSCSSLLLRSSVQSFLEKTQKMEFIRDSINVAQGGIARIFTNMDEHLQSTEIVETIVRAIFDEKVDDEIEKRVIVGIILDLIVESIKSSEFPEFVAFDKKEWKISGNPRELHLSNALVKLPAKCGKTQDVKLFLTPNFFGKFSKNLKMRLAISNPSLCPKQSVDETVINIPVLYECQPPDLIIHNQMNSISGFAESEITLNILVENAGTSDGFFSFIHFDDPEMEVKCDIGKFHIAKKSKKLVELIVTPLKSGLISKNVNLAVLGSNRKLPISIECKSLPPDIVIMPNKIFESNLEVLKSSETKIIIENRSTTKARFFVKLNHENEAFDVSPRGGILGGKKAVAIILKKEFQDPGEYRNILIVEIVNSKAIKIPIKLSVEKLPILIEPSINSTIDFGTLFVSKTPYFHEYNLTNRGRNTYVIFIILKNLRNKNETKYIVDPSRFELEPNMTRSVKFYINAENSFISDEDLWIEGCSVNFPNREVIKEAKLVANIIRPTLCFSQNDVKLKCFFNEEPQNQLIQIINKSNLSLPVALKVEGDFFLFAEETQQFEKKVKYDMRMNESRGFYLNFDSSKIQPLKEAKNFAGKVKAFSLGKLQATLSIEASVIFPTVDISNCDLKIVNDLQPTSFQFTITNNGEMDSAFELKFKDSSTILTKLQERKQESLMNIVQCLARQKVCLREKFFMKDADNEMIESLIDDETEKTEVSTTEDSHELNAKVDNVEKKQEMVEALAEPADDSPQIKLDDVQRYLKNLTKALSEVILKKESHAGTVTISSTSEERPADSAEKFLKISQLKGMLKPRESRMVSVYFIGSQDAFHLSTVLTCHVAGGMIHDININLTNCNSNVLITKTFFEIPREQPWNEILLKNICISNIAPAENQIKLLMQKPNDDNHQLVNGYVKLNSKTDPNFTLDEHRDFCTDVKFSIFKGCSSVFHHEFGVQVNQRPPIPISFFGVNELPNATILDLSRDSLNDINKGFEYDCLRQLFKDYVNRIGVADEDVKVEEVLKIKAQMKLEKEKKQSRRKSLRKDRNKNGGKDSSLSTMSGSHDYGAGDGENVTRGFGLFYESNGRLIWREKSVKSISAKMLHMVDGNLDEEGFQVLDYPDEYPRAIEITNSIAQQGFSESMKSDEIFKEFKHIYNKHVLEKFRQMKNQSRVSSHPEFIYDSHVVPLPLILQQYELNLGTIQMNESVEKVLKIYCHGSQLNASIRTEVFIPDMSLQFLQRSETGTGSKVVDYDLSSLQEYGIYQNRYERERNSVEKMTIVKRSHSFDFDNGRVHTRPTQVTAQQRNKINKIYNQLMSTKPKEERNPLVQSEIFLKSPINDESRIFDMKLVFMPTSHCYESDTMFEEIIYLDIHLGPQIPINVKAKIVQELKTEISISELSKKS